MKRLGKFSGIIYEEDEVNNMEECGVLLTDAQANDEEFIKSHHLLDQIECSLCRGCPKAQLEVLSDD